MNLYRHIRPTLMGASALMLSACSYGAYTAPANTVAEPQLQTTNRNELVSIADTLAAGGDHSAAIPLYRQVASRTGNPKALTGLATSLIAQGANDEASGILRTLISRGQATATVWYSLGKTQLGNGRFEDALLSFSNAQAAGDTSSRTKSGKAIALAALGRTDEAMRAFGTGTDRLSLTNKALVMAATGHAKAATYVLESVMQRGNGNSRDRQNLAMSYLLAGDEEEAYRIARIDLDPASINETFTFYRSLASLSPAQRMKALVTGTVNPEWTRSEMANLELQESNEREEAASRLVKGNKLARAKQGTRLAMASKQPPAPKPKETPKAVSRENYVLKEIPPLVEPEGWALQIGAYRTIKNLMKGWTILYRQSGDILEGVPPRRSEIDFGDRKGKPSGFYYRLNAGPLKTFARAKELCEELKSRGTSCWIRPPEKKEGKLPEPATAKRENQATIPSGQSVQTSVGA